jgi:predicted RNA binding protein YcfA (HicA-like mRNA interferase family)
MNSLLIIKLLKKDGWMHILTTGDHYHFRHSKKMEIVTVPHPKKDVPIGTLKSIERQSGIKLNG